MKYLFNSTNLDKLLVFFIILLSSRASTVANAEVTIFVALVVNLCVMAFRRVNIGQPFIMFVIPLFALFVLQNYLHAHGAINLLRYVKLFCIISVAYCTIRVVQFDFFDHYTDIIFGAILFSLPFYAWQVVSINSLHQVGNALSHAFPALVDNQPTSQNILFHTIEFVDKYRNSGPMWEPGGFATMIALAMYFELLRNHFSINKKIIVYLIGIVITFSTTGYILLLALFLLYMVNVIKKQSARTRSYLYIITIPLFITGAAAVFFSSDLMYNKISFLYQDQMAKVEDMQHVQDLGLDGRFSLGRFGSLLVDMESVKENPAFGRGYDDDAFRLGGYDSFNLTNGLSNYVARLGLVGLLWLVLSMYKSGRLIEFALTGTSGRNNILLLFVLIIAFSNPVLFTPLYIMLSMLFIPFRIVKTQPQLT